MAEDAAGVFTGRKAIDFDVRRFSLPVLSDSVKIVFYRHSLIDTERLFYLWFHPAFVAEK